MCLCMSIHVSMETTGEQPKGSLIRKSKTNFFSASVNKTDSNSWIRGMTGRDFIVVTKES